jgi:DMSO/TMAO reductase YedYZ molybdopterin-dependent catalytic subunit
MINKYHDRRGFLKKSALATLASIVGVEAIFANHMPAHFTPLVLADDALKGKNPEMIILSDKPWNVEAPMHLLDDAVTPIENMFVRNNGLPPEEAINPATWTLTINGESVKKTKTYKISDLKKRFKNYTYQLVLECGGNGRSGYQPQTSGNQWGQGGVHCAEWTGVRLKDILADVGLKDDAVYIGYYGKDVHLSHDPSKVAISRGVPMRKALEDETLIAWAVNHQDIPLIHGCPLRLVIGGWPASTSGKWLHTISVRNIVHDGPKMEPHSYQMPIFPIEPGQELASTAENYRIIESLPVKSIITYPKTGAMFNAGTKLSLRGHAWAGDLKVNEVHTSIDYGASWQKTALQPAKNRLAWQHWSADIDFPQKGYYEVWVRATDENGIMQPMLIPQWNPGGYLNNACQRIAVKVG